MDAEDFEAVRNDPDPVRRGRRATDLLNVYQQRSVELARLRREAIEQARDQQKLSYSEIATAIGVTKGRVSQIRSTAPEAERAFFGVGPVSVGVPYRYGVTDRSRPLIAAEDAATADAAIDLLEALNFTAQKFNILPDTTKQPTLDAIVICGPKSAPLATTLLEDDPALKFVSKDGKWNLEDRNGSVYRSPLDLDPSKQTDTGYLARHVSSRGIIIHIAGIHAIGSLGVLHYLTTNVGRLYNETKDHSFSAIIESDHDQLAIQTSRLVSGPYIW